MAKAFDGLPSDIAPADHLGPCQRDELNDAPLGQGAQERPDLFERRRLYHRDMPALARNRIETGPDSVGIGRAAQSDVEV
jgi:hypothetical protein